jgi:predicted membrane protein
LECGATDATLNFTTPNRTPMREMEIDVGAADFFAQHLANANAENVRLRGGVGVVDLDFGGAWTQDMNVSARLAIGKLVLRVPTDVGVRLEVQRVAAGFEHPGLVKRDDAWYSDNWDSASHKLHVRAETFFGKIEVRRDTR